MDIGCMLEYDSLEGGPQNSKMCKCKHFYGNDEEWLESFMRKCAGTASDDDLTAPKYIMKLGYC